MTWYKWVLIGLGAVLAIAGTVAVAMYFALRSGGPVWQAYNAGTAHFNAAVDSLRRDQARGFDSIGKLVASSNASATAGQHQDVTVSLDTGVVAAWVDSLLHARTAADSLLRYPPIVAGQQTTITDLTASRNDWRSAFNTQAEATASAIALYAGDTLFRGKLLTHLDSLPKPPRTGFLGWLLTPRPFIRAGWNSRTGTYLDGGACLGCSP